MLSLVYLIKTKYHTTPTFSRDSAIKITTESLGRIKWDKASFNGPFVLKFGLISLRRCTSKLYLQQLGVVSIIKRQSTVNNGVKHYSHAPNVGILRPIWNSLQYFWRCVSVAPTEGFTEGVNSILRLHVTPRESKIGQFDVETMIHQKVFTFYVPRNFFYNIILRKLKLAGFLTIYYFTNVISSTVYITEYL